APAAFEASAQQAANLFQEHDMSCIDAFSTLLGLDDVAAPELDEAQRQYLAGFVGGLRSLRTTEPAGVPVLPAHAPFPAQTRVWLDGLLAGLFSRAEPIARSAALAAPEDKPHGVRIAHTRPKVVLLWASQTGNVESLVERYAMQLMESGFEIRTACMADYPLANLAKAQYVLLMTSTFGDGDAPDNGAAFWSALAVESAPRLAALRFSVLSLGDRNYDQFCAHGRKLDARLEALGATRLMERVDCDSEYQSAADAWLDRIVVRIKAEDAALHAVPADGSIPEVLPGCAATKARPAVSKLLKNVRLNMQGATKDTRYFSLATGEAGLDYEAGDALGVWPTNCPALVDELLGLTRLAADTPVSVSGQGEMRLGEALSKHYEIARPNADALAFIASRTRSRGLAEMLDETRKGDLRNWLWGQQLADVLHEYPVDMNAPELLGMLKRLQPRLYSISSSPKAHAGEVHLTVSAVRYSNGRRERKGVASTFLADRAQEGSVPVFVQKSTHFRPPRNGDAPMIMVGPGTGVAPFRAFLHERQARGDTGRNWLFFGEQHAATDFYYRDELEQMRKDGHLDRLDLAFSRDQSEKVYVQDRMREQGAQLWAWLQEGAHLYVCGDASRMAKDVDAALKEVVCGHGGMSGEAAHDYVSALARDKRYVRDVY
ncbi:MAG TPA: flavodoxin domain-containing protein, partial [Paraburkholderia sp.]|uniref:diflavin oxidoreductase n=1 Tax=Paraburkholderia sp. TaxID=1926495 RepID=UPI002B795EAD